MVMINKISNDYLFRDDIAGLENVKDSLKEATVLPIKKPSWFKDLKSISVSLLSIVHFCLHLTT